MNLAMKLCVNPRLVVLATMAILLLPGCGPSCPTAEELSSFKTAGPAQVQVNDAELALAPPHQGDYCLVSGDLLSVKMPEVLQAIYPDMPPEGLMQPFQCRVRPDGSLDLPTAGTIPASGRTLNEIETAIADAFCPQYLAKRPAISAQVAEFRLIKATITGAVEKPGLYELRSDEMSLMGLLNKAGGVGKEGAHIMTVSRPGMPQSLVLPVHDLNVPYANVALEGGETVEVQRLEPQVFTVIGLVKRPGVFAYPGDVHYDLIQALGYAGGLDDVTDPQHVTIFRRNEQGELVQVNLRITGKDLLANANMPIKPGDALFVQHTPRTRTRQAAALMLRSGLYAGATYDFNED